MIGNLNTIGNLKMKGTPNVNEKSVMILMKSSKKSMINLLKDKDNTIVEVEQKTQQKREREPLKFNKSIGRE